MSCTPRNKILRMLKSTNSISTLLFDWDGTLADSAHLGRAAFEKTFADLSVPFSHEIYEAHYSPNWFTVYEALGLPRDVWPAADELWRRYYGEQLAELVDGAADTLMELRRSGYRLGVVTSGNADRVGLEIEAASLPEIFETIVCAEHIANRKPHPEGLEIALRRLDCDRERAAYVGDAPEDIEMGKQAGVLTIGVRSNYPSSARLLDSEPDLYLESISELGDYFRERMTE